jgi:hypothetical protein
MGAYFIVWRQCSKNLTDPLKAFGLIVECGLRPWPAVYFGFKRIVTSHDGLGICQQERCIKAAYLAEQWLQFHVRCSQIELLVLIRQ